MKWVQVQNTQSQHHVHIIHNIHQFNNVYAKNKDLKSQWGRHPPGDFITACLVLWNVCQRVNVPNRKSQNTHKTHTEHTLPHLLKLCVCLCVFKFVSASSRKFTYTYLIINWTINDELVLLLMKLSLYLSPSLSLSHSLSLSLSFSLTLSLSLYLSLSLSSLLSLQPNKWSTWWRRDTCTSWPAVASTCVA